MVLLSRICRVLAVVFICLIVIPTFARDAIQAHALFPPKIVDDAYPRHYRPNRVVDYVSMNLELKFVMDELRVEGIVHYTVVPLHDAVVEMQLDAMEMDIQSVEAHGWETVDWTYSDNVLYITFPQPLRTEETTISVAFGYTNPRDGLVFSDFDELEPKHADQVHTLSEPASTRYWFPCADYPNDRLVTEMTVTVPKKFTTLSNGVLVRSEEKGAWRTDYWKQEIPHVFYLVSIVVGEFEIVADDWNGIPVEYYVEPAMKDAARPTFAKTPAMIDFFSQYFGYAYPYEKYAQVHVRNFKAGGMEHTTATTLYEWAVLDEEARIDHDMDWLIAHELAHQWFGDLVTCESWPELWLNEGFATFSECLWAEHDRGMDEYYYHLWGDFTQYFGSSNRYIRSIVSNEFEDAYEMFDAHSYPKAGSVLSMLRHRVGDANFRKIIAHYLERHAPGLVDSKDFRDAVTAITGRSMDRFFEQWIYRAGHPKLEIRHEWLSEKKQLKIVVKQTQKREEGDPAFAFPLLFEIVCGDNVIHHSMDVSRYEETAFIDCPSAPDSIVADPELHVLAEIDHERSLGMLVYTAMNGSNAVVRLRALQALKGKKKETVIATLRDILKQEPFYAVREEAARQLQGYSERDAKDALRACLNEPESRVRVHLVRGLGTDYKDEEIYSLLKEIYQNDESQRVRQAAIEGLARLNMDGTYALLRPGLQQESYRETIRRSVMDALSKTKKAKAYQDILPYTKSPYRGEVRSKAMQSIAILSRELEIEQEKTLDLLLTYLHSTSETLQQYAISALRELQSEDAISYLQNLADTHASKSIRDHATGAIAHIRKHVNSDQSVKNSGILDTLKADWKKMQDRLHEMEVQIEALQEAKQ